MASVLDFGVASKIPFERERENLDQDASIENLDDNFFGNASTEISNTDTTEIGVPDGLIKNPYFSGIDNQVQNMEDQELFSRFKKSVAICKKDGINVPPSTLVQIYQKTLKQVDFESLAQYFTLVRVSNKLIKNKCHRQTSFIVARPILNIFNSSQISLENEELVIPLFELSEDQVDLYNCMYESPYNISVITKANTLYQYFTCDSYKFVVIDRLTKMFTDINEANYWTHSYHCGINITDAFQNRTFKSKELMDNQIKASITSKSNNIQDNQDNDAKNIFDKITNSQNKNTNYMENVYRKRVFTDASSGIKQKGQKYRLYRIDNELPVLTKDQTTEIFNSIKEQKLLFNTFNTFLLSKTHCHLVINNQTVLKKMQPFFKGKLLAFYNYVFGYAWTCMYFEECIMKTRTKNTSRYVFDINTAHNLPFFPYCAENIHMNPYCVLTVDEKSVKSKENYHGLPMISDYKEYGIDNLEGFVTKFNIFTTGKPDKNIFDGLETVPGTKPETKRWKHFAMSGSSVIPACAQKRNPLIDQVSMPQMSYSDKLNRYFNEYYSDSDIDVMCDSKSVFDFMDNIASLVEVIVKNLSAIEGKDVRGTIEVEPIKTLSILVHSKFIEENMKDIGNVDYIIKNITSQAVKERFHEEYYNCKRIKNNQYRKIKKGNALYEHFYKILSIDEMSVKITSYEIVKDAQYESDCDTYIYLKDILPQDKKVPDNQNILILKVSECLKFKIRSPKMLHSIEAFRTKYDDYFSCVSRFHLPCVRGYYNYEDVYLLPSCITALMTYTNMDYKYFAGMRDPIEIINKYRMRGYGTIINEQEKMNVIEYNSSVNKWKGMFTVDSKNKSSVLAHFGPKKLNDNIYKPGFFLRGHPEDAYKKLDLKYIMTVDDYYNHYKVSYGYVPETIDFLKFRSVSENGSLSPLKKWIIDAAYDQLF